MGRTPIKAYEAMRLSIFAVNNETRNPAKIITSFYRGA